MPNPVVELALVIKNKCPEKCFTVPGNISIGRYEVSANTSVDIQVASPNDSRTCNISRRGCLIRINSIQPPKLLLIATGALNGLFLESEAGWRKVERHAEVTIDSKIRLGNMHTARISDFFTDEQVKMLRKM